MASSLSPSRQTRRLSWDVLSSIFVQADPSTSFVLCQVSFDVLSIAAPILYGAVEIKTPAELLELFGQRRFESVSKPSRVNRFLSFNQLNTLFINFTSPTIRRDARLWGSHRDLDHLHPLAHLLHLPPIQLDLLRVHWRLPEIDNIRSLYEHLFPHFNPLRLDLANLRSGSLRPTSFVGPTQHWTPFPYSYPVADLKNWTRLEVVDLRAHAPVGVPSIDSTPLDSWARFLTLPKEKMRAVKELRVHLSSFVDDPVTAKNVKEFMDEVGTRGDRHGFSEVEIEDGRLMMITTDEKQKKFVEEALEGDKREQMRWSIVVDALAPSPYTDETYSGKFARYF